MGERIERSALLRSRTRVTLDEQGRSLAVSDDAKNTFEEWGRNPDEVEQNFREWWYSDKPEELQQRIRETEVPVKSKTIVENFMIPDKTKPKKGRGGLINFHKWKKKKKRKVMQDFLDNPTSAKNEAELMAALLGGRARLNRIARRLKKHPEDNVIKFPKKKPLRSTPAGRALINLLTKGELPEGDIPVSPFMDDIKNELDSKFKPKKPKKNMGGLLSLYE